MKLIYSVDQSYPLPYDYQVATRSVNRTPNNTDRHYRRLTQSYHRLPSPRLPLSPSHRAVSAAAPDSAHRLCRGGKNAPFPPGVPPFISGAAAAARCDLGRAAG